MYERALGLLSGILTVGLDCLKQHAPFPSIARAFVKNASKDTDQHSERNTVENDVLSRLAKEDRMLKEVIK